MRHWKHWKVINLTGLILIMAVIGLALGMSGSRVVLAQGDGPNPRQPEPLTAGEVALRGTTYWAVVRRDGTIARSRGAVSSAHPAAGNYQVNFLDNIRACSYTATIGDFDAVGVESPGEITTVGNAADVRGVFLTTHNSAGANQDRAFHLLVSC